MGHTLVCWTNLPSTVETISLQREHSMPFAFAATGSGTGRGCGSPPRRKGVICLSADWTSCDGHTPINWHNSSGVICDRISKIAVTYSSTRVIHWSAFGSDARGLRIGMARRNMPDTFVFAELRADFGVQEVEDLLTHLRLLGECDDLVGEVLAELALLVAPRRRDARRTHARQDAHAGREEGQTALANAARSSRRLQVRQTIPFITLWINIDRLSPIQISRALLCAVTSIAGSRA